MRFPTPFFSYSAYPTVENRQGSYHPELDVLRFVAFLAVFMHHALPRDARLYISHGLSPTATQWLLTAKEAGAFGLDLFFALSAYLITELLLREHATRGSFSVSAFYIRRALRIWPLYFTFLALTVFVIPTILPRENFGSAYIASFAFFVGNWVCASKGIPFSVAGPLWSISVEEQFYIGWPLLLRFFGINRIKQLAIGMLLLALITRVVLVVYGVKHPAVWCNTLARLDPIALGAILAFVLRGRAPQIKNALRLLLCAMAFGSWWLIARYLSHDGTSSIATYALSAFASVVLLLAVLRGEARLLDLPPFSWLVYLGRISYGLYVFHLLALAVMMNVLFVPGLGIPISFVFRVLLSFLLTVGLAATSYTWLEEPFLRLKERFAYRPAQKSSPILSRSSTPATSSYSTLLGS
ncbi:MAG TPA: acyltransferase [Pyrinomonadaceae bacterium]|nr:acyltransferase [Pyrinomonadaceae bacterium]